MRQLGTLTNESDAQRLAAWLVTQRIDAHTEPDGDGWALWVRDEDHLDDARAALEHFRANPQDERYRTALGTAERLRREEEQQKAKAVGNIVEMRGRWGSGASGAARRCPLVLALIAIAILVALFTNAGFSQGPFLDGLRFVSLHDVITPAGLDVWASVRQGEVWRLLSPVFIHFGLWHLIFNAFCLLDFGGQVENRRGTWYMLLFVLAVAVLSNVGQALEATYSSTGGINFGGLSGVTYGLFGYLLVKVKFDNREAYRLSQTTMFMGIGWFILCLAREFTGDEGLFSFMPNIANSAHAVGLFVGMTVAYFPIALRGKAS